MRRINILTVWTGDRYSRQYVDKMKSMLERHLKMDMDFYCITDNPDDIGWNKIVPPEPLVGWWSKMWLFSDLMPSGKILYLDLDQLITGDITEILEECLKHKFSAYSDHLNWHGCKFGSAFMLFDSGAHTDIFKAFWPARHELVDYPGGDQAWINQTGLLPKVYYLDEHFPGGIIQSYKLDYLPHGLSEHTKLINFHGQPKQHNLKTPLIREYWN